VSLHCPYGFRPSPSCMPRSREMKRPEEEWRSCRWNRWEIWSLLTSLRIELEHFSRWVGGSIPRSQMTSLDQLTCPDVCTAPRLRFGAHPEKKSRLSWNISRKHSYSDILPQSINSTLYGYASLAFVFRHWVFSCNSIMKGCWNEIPAHGNARCYWEMHLNQ